MTLYPPSPHFFAERGPMMRPTVRDRVDCGHGLRTGSAGAGEWRAAGGADRPVGLSTGSAHYESREARPRSPHPDRGGRPRPPAGLPGRHAASPPITARRRGGAIPRALWLLSALVLAACVLAGGTARADVLVTNTGKLATDDQFSSVLVPVAQGFVTGATAYTLTSVEMDFNAARNVANLTASIWTADGSDNPGSELVGLTNPMSISGCFGCVSDNTVEYSSYTGTPVVFNVASPTTLSANTRYFVRVYYSVNVSGLFAVLDNDETSTVGWTIDDAALVGNAAPPTSWTARFTSVSVMLRINGTVSTPNTAPVVANAIPDQSAAAGTFFRYAFPADAFTDAEGDTLTYGATKADGAALPTWLSFAAGTRIFSGTPQAADVGTVSVKVTASDGNGGSVSDDFDITVTDPPSVVRNLRATVGAMEVLLFWYPPAKQEGDSRISHYEYRLARGSTVQGVRWARLPRYIGNGAGFLELQNGALYTFEVRAVNASGAGPAAQVRATPSPRGSSTSNTPGAPRNFRAAVLRQPYVAYREANKQAHVDVTLSWAAPASNGNVRIFRYEYRHAEGSSVPTGSSWRHAAGTSPMTVRSLKAGTGYAFEMRAVNDVGAGPLVRGRLTTTRYSGPTVTLQVSGSAREGEPFTLRARRGGPWTGDSHVLFELEDSAFSPRSRRMYELRAAEFGATGTTATATYVPRFDNARPDRRTFTVRVSDVRGDYVITSGTVTVTVADADAALSVAGASVREGPGAKLRFVVRLDRARDRTITVDYATSDDTANAGTDYTATSGTLSIAPGSRQAVIEVPVLQDDVDDDGERLTLTLRNAAGAIIQEQDGVVTATGTIRNTGSLPTAWTARFGRTVGEQAMEAVEARFGAPRAPGLLGRIGGQQISGAEDAEDRAAETETRQGLETLAGWVSGKSGKEGDARAFGWRPLTGREMLTGSSFALTGGTAETGFGAFWGRGVATRFDGREGELTLDGEVASAMMGADWTRDRVLAGLMLSHSRGDGGYGSPKGSGEVSSTLTALFPYGRYALSKRVSVWGMAGYGEGTLTLTPEGEAPMRPDMDLAMGAVGVRGVLFDGGTEGPTLAATADTMAVRTSTGAVTGLAASEADVTRVRLALKGSQPFGLGGDAVLTPSLELGVRHDGGDAETGFGADMGAGLALAAPSRGLSAELRARGLLTHEAGGMRERGVSGTLAWDPAPKSDRGIAFKLSQTVGAQASGGVDALLARPTLAGLGAEEDEERLGRRLEARLGYGLGVFGERWTATPELGVGLSDTGRELRLGWRLTERVVAGLAFELRVEGTRRESVDGEDGAANPKHGLGVSLGWRLVKARTSHAAFEMRIAAHLDAANDDAPAEGRIGLMLTARW